MQPEARLVKRIVAKLNDAGAVSFKIHGGDNPFQAVGIPDLLVVWWGWFVGIEVKLPGESLRPAQVVALREIFASGGIAAVIETAEQVDVLRSYLEDWRRSDYDEARGTYRGILFNRGRISHRWALKA